MSYLGEMRSRLALLQAVMPPVASVTRTDALSSPEGKSPAAGSSQTEHDEPLAQEAA